MRTRSIPSVASDPDSIAPTRAICVSPMWVGWRDGFQIEGAEEGRRNNEQYIHSRSDFSFACRETADKEPRLCQSQGSCPAPTPPRRDSATTPSPRPPCFIQGSHYLVKVRTRALTNFCHGKSVAGRVSGDKERSGDSRRSGADRPLVE